VLHAHLSVAAIGRAPKTEAWIFATRPARLRGDNIFWLDQRHSLRNAARHLFATLRRVDEGRFTRIHLERVPGGGLADAINDRLERAASRA
jgi:L-threonylcarbamoyladenylate synthase